MLTRGSVVDLFSEEEQEALPRTTDTSVVVGDWIISIETGHWGCAKDLTVPPPHQNCKCEYPPLVSDG